MDWLAGMKALTLSDYDLTPWQKLWEGKEQDLMQLLENIMAGRGFFSEDANGFSAIMGSLNLATFWQQLIVPTLIIAMLSLLLHSLDAQEDHLKLLRMLMMVSLAMTLAMPLMQCCDLASEAIETVLSFMQVALPVFSTAVAAVGQLASASTLVPAMLATLAFMMPVLQTCVLPMSRGMMLLSIVNSMHGEHALSGIVKFMRSAVQWILGLAMTVMIGILSVQGAAVMAFDTVSLKTARYTVATMLPVAGGMFAEMVGSLMTGAVLVKSALGTAGLIGIGVACFDPVLRMLLTGLSLQLSAALVQLMGEKKLSNVLTQMAQGVNTLLTVVLLTLAMACIMLTMVMNMGVI